MSNIKKRTIIWCVVALGISSLGYSVFDRVYEPVSVFDIDSMNQLPRGGDAFYGLETFSSLHCKRIEKYRYDQFYLTGHMADESLKRFAQCQKTCFLYEGSTVPVPSVIIEAIRQLQSTNQNYPEWSKNNWFLSGSIDDTIRIFIGFDIATQIFWANITVQRNHKEIT